MNCDFSYTRRNCSTRTRILLAPSHAERTTFLAHYRPCYSCHSYQVVPFLDIFLKSVPPGLSWK